MAPVSVPRPSLRRSGSRASLFHPMRSARLTRFVRSASPCALAGCPAYWRLSLAGCQRPRRSGQKRRQARRGRRASPPHHRWIVGASASFRRSGFVVRVAQICISVLHSCVPYFVLGWRVDPLRGGLRLIEGRTLAHVLYDVRTRGGCLCTIPDAPDCACAAVSAPVSPIHGLEAIGCVPLIRPKIPRVLASFRLSPFHRLSRAATCLDSVHSCLPRHSPPSPGSSRQLTTRALSCGRCAPTACLSWKTGGG